MAEAETPARTFTVQDFMDWGRKGGQARKANLTDAELSAIGRKAARARERKKDKNRKAAS